MAKNIRKQNTEVQKPGNQRMELIPRFAFTAFLTVTLLAVSATPVFASNIFEVAKNAMQGVFFWIVGIGLILQSVRSSCMGTICRMGVCLVVWERTKTLISEKSRVE